MLLSLALIILCALVLSKVMTSLKMPALVGMILTGIILGPAVLDAIDPGILGISSEIRQMALVVILIRAGLSIDLDDLRQVGRPAVLLSFVPATFEVVAVSLFAPMVFGISWTDALVLGAVLAAVSPAVVVPRMIRLINQGYGRTRKVPHLVLAGASLDDVFVLVLFASFLRLGTGEGMSAWTLLSLPLSVVMGVGAGLVAGEVFTRLVKKVHMRDTVKVLIMASVGFLFIVLEESIGEIVPFSGLIAVIAFSAMILRHHHVLARRLVLKFEKIWVLAEIALFVLVGAALDITSAFDLGLLAAVFIILMLLVRSVGVLVAMTGSGLPWRERLFVVFAYLPKATVQAAIGAVPLSMGLDGGQTILTLAVLSIIITAPVGALLVDLGHHKLLKADLEV